MSLPAGFKETLAEKTDQELFDIVAHATDYIPEAIQAAQAELLTRNLDPDKAMALQAAAEQKCLAEAGAAAAPLSGPARVLIVFLSGTCLPALLWITVLSARYRSKGYLKKADQCWTWFWIGVAFWFALGLMLLAFRG